MSKRKKGVDHTSDLFESGSLASHGNRKKLKQSFETNRLVYDKHVNSVKSSNDLLSSSKDTLTMPRQSPHMGEGSNGSEHILTTEDDETVWIAKLSVCFTPLIGSLKSPYRSEHVEPRMAKFRWHQSVEKHRSPHICRAMGEHCVTEGTTPVIRKMDQYAKHTVIQFMEHAKYSDVRHYLSCLDVNKLDTHVRVILFQVCYTLCGIYKLFPEFRHNDLKDDNVLLQEGPTDTVCYKVDDKTTFYVQGLGIRALLADFDFSCMRAIIDNGKLLEESFNSPSMHVNTRKDYGADIYLFVKCIYLSHKDSLSTQLINQLHRLWKHNVLDTLITDEENYLHATPSMAKTLPTAQRIMNSDLFSCFRRAPKAPIVETWALSTFEKGEVVEFPAWDPTITVKGKGHKEMVRRVHLFYPRQQHTRSRGIVESRVNPSFDFFDT